MSELNHKIATAFPGRAVRKDLVGKIKGGQVVPTYVLEYLLGQYCASEDEATVNAGIETVRGILQQHFVSRSESELWKANIKESGGLRIIDKISVYLNDKKDQYEAVFSNLMLAKVPIPSSIVLENPRLLVSGVWCLIDVEYSNVGEGDARIPWVIQSLKPIQTAKIDMDEYFAARSSFTTDEWIDLLIQSLGFEPEHFSRRQKFMQLLRLVPFIERNYNLIELGPKGTGKSHVYSEFSPDGMLISGGEITVAKLFVNNASGKLGLVAFWNVVAFDEFAGRTKTSPKALVDIMKNYMANRSFSRGVETITAEASMVFVGNTDNTVSHMLENDHLFSALPSNYIDSAFLDRIHCYLPGWESDMIRREMFTSGFGLVVDFFAGVLKALRDQDLSHLIQDHFRVSSSITTRDTDGVKKTFSGLFKLIFPNGQATQDEIEELLQISMEGRKRVKDQLYRLDPTISQVEFTYSDASGTTREVLCQEEIEYPDLYKMRPTAVVEELPPTPNQASPMNAEELVQLLSGKSEVFMSAPSMKSDSEFGVLTSLIEGLAESSGDRSLNFELLTNLEEDPAVQENQIDSLDQISDGFSSRGVAFSYSFESVPGNQAKVLGDGVHLWSGPLA
jgi:ATP-dependent Lon protease